MIEHLLHIDVYLQILLQNYGLWLYGLLFLIIFCETGLVFLPFLPGDSLLFAAGSLAVLGGLDVHYLATLLITAAVLGNTVNYWVGHYFGAKLFKRDDSLFFKPRYLTRTHEFYERHGRKTIIFARFIPIIRTIAPFVAGMGKMDHRIFMSYNLIGSLAWVGLILYSGYFFGSTSFVRNNFSLLMLAIIIISVLPPAIGVLRAVLRKR